MNKYEKHLLFLADQMGVELDFFAHDDDWGAASATVGPHCRATLPRPVGEGTAERNYWVGLHELGHIAHRHEGSFFDSFFPPSTRLVAQEAEAWDWALTTGCKAPSSTSRVVIGAAMASYLDDMKADEPWPSTAAFDFVMAVADLDGGRRLLQQYKDDPTIGWA